MSSVRIIIDGRESEHPTGTTVAELLPASPGTAPGLPPLAALVNNDLASLSYPLTVNSTVEAQSLATPHGWRVYRRSLCFLLAKVVHEDYPGADFSVQHAFGTGLYCRFSDPARHQDGITDETCQAIAARLRALTAAGRPIERRKLAYMDAVAALEACGLAEKAALLRHRNPPRVVMHWCDGFCDLAHGPLAPSTDLLQTFSLLPYPPGFVLQIPDREAPHEVAPFHDQPHLFQIYQEHKAWGQILGIDTVSRLNGLTTRDAIQEFIFTAEALHERKLAAIAEAISTRRPRPRILLIAGPSAAGKTTVAKRLSIHLRVHGLQPLTLGTDNYFVGEDRNPRLPDGRPDYEHLEAVDLEAFNQDLSTLTEGGRIRVRSFNFHTRSPELTERFLTLSDDQLLIIEGIHGLNPRLTPAIPEAAKFRLYVSALTQLSVDRNNRISTTDNRLMRRLVRDFTYRGHTALETLRLWPQVRQGEKRWIFPFQQQADATFNSALDYELAVLKPLVEPLLAHVKPDVPEYAESRRLTEFLLNFVPIPDAFVPPASILRETIGGSVLCYD